MALSKNFIPEKAEQKWYKHWMEKGYFRSTPDERKPFTIVIPPPNITGVLHMGHTLNETVQDILIRRARMQGFNACWVPGSDHASIATEAKVVGMLKEKGIKKSDISREEFLKHAFEWKEKYGGIIYQQIKKLGCSCDWDRTTFTMDDHYYKAVIKTFVSLYKKGIIYRGARMIHWDPVAQTALSDEEVEYREVNSKLYYVRYPVDNSEGTAGGTDGFITIATTRPETIPGDTAICINPTDKRYRHLKGKFAFVPIVNRRVPVIEDEYVDKEFGTGCLKITPAHDINDYNIGLKHHLATVDVFNPDGTMSDAAGVFPGEDRFIVREKMVKELTEKGFLVKTEDIINKNGFSQRTNAVVEPRISTQWFLKMSELARPALEAVVNDDIKFYPEGRFINTYRYWMENIKDWCISRQLWWGQQIPAWYDEEGNVFVAETEEEANHLKNKTQNSKLKTQNPKPETRNSKPETQNPKPETQNSKLERDEDVLDTWFSSWLWPMEVFKGISNPGNKDFNYYYPTSVLVTGQDIIFFWVARMIMAGMEFENEKPFGHVYFTGMVRDKLGRKMSKSLGNSPDLLQLIEQYGADAVRFGIMIASPAGNDLLFDESSLEQGRNFCNKMWNALKLVQSWKKTDEPAEEDQFATTWFEHKLNATGIILNNLFDNYKLSEALKILYSLIWDDFCSWYLEWIKPPYQKPIASVVAEKTIVFFERLLQLLHPFMPFVTEEIYHQLRERKPGDDLIVRQLVSTPSADNNILKEGETARKVITAIRDTRNKHQLKNKDTIQLHIFTSKPETYQAFNNILKKQVNASEISYTTQPVQQSITVIVEADKIYIEAPDNTNSTLQKNKLLQDLAHQKNFLAAVEKKLANEKFIQHAKPELVERERKKQSDAEARIKAIEESLKVL